MWPAADTKTSRLSLLEKFLAILTAALALGSAYLGYLSASNSNAKEQAQAQVADTSNDLTKLRAELGKLEAENRKLGQQLGLPGSSDDDPPGPDASVTVRRTGEVTLAAGNWVDLDSPSDPQWGDGESDLGYAPGGNELQGNGSGIDLLYLGGTEADYESCSKTTGYNTKKIGAVAASHICVKTGENRYAALRIEDFDTDKITLAVTVYDPPVT